MWRRELGGGVCRRQQTPSCEEKVRAGRRRPNAVEEKAAVDVAESERQIDEIWEAARAFNARGRGWSVGVGFDSQEKAKEGLQLGNGSCESGRVQSSRHAANACPVRDSGECLNGGCRIV